MTQHTDSSNHHHIDRHIDRTDPSTGSRRRAGLAALAALGLPLGALLAPNTVAAAPGGPLDDIDLDVVLPQDQVPSLPGGFLPALLPQFPIPVPPIPVPPGPPMPDDVPGPDDGPGLPFEAPELDLPFDLLPFDPGDFVFPTDPVDPGEDPDDGDDDEAPEPECTEYSAANFGVDVERYDADLIEVKLSYSDVDVCDFTVWTAIAEPGAVGVLGETLAGMESIAFATESAGYYQQTFSDHDLCDLEIRVAVEESLDWAVPYTDGECDTPGEDEVPADDGEVPADDDGEVPADDDGEVPADDDGEVPVDDDGEVPVDDDGMPVDDGESRPLGEPETPGTPTTPGGGLPQTGTDLTTVMLALGLITLGAGSVVALATRRREEAPIA